MKRGSFVTVSLFSLALWVVATLPGDDLQRIQAAPKNPLLQVILSDPFMHFFVFGLLAVLLCVGFCSGSARPIPLAKVALLAFGYGLLIEVYQAILPWRSFGLDDLAWNTVGILFFLAVFRWHLSEAED